MPAAISIECNELPPQPISPRAQKETVIIFDWDDTLLCSSFLAARGYNRLDEAQNRAADVDSELALLERAVVGVLSLALRFGAVYIITNAESGWVQLSAETFLPSVRSVLEHIKIRSARSQYEPLFPQAPAQWKYCAFHDNVVDTLGESDTGEQMRNVVSFGDSRVEREAVLSVTRELPRVRCKSIKFAERPTIEQLRLQLELVTRCFATIATHEGDLDLQLSILPSTSAVAAAGSVGSTPVPSAAGPAPPAVTADASPNTTKAATAAPVSAPTAGALPLPPSTSGRTGVAPMETEPAPAAAPSLTAAVSVEDIHLVQLSGYENTLPVSVDVDQISI